jgi:hypothetical protein
MTLGFNPTLYDLGRFLKSEIQSDCVYFLAFGFHTRYDGALWRTLTNGPALLRTYVITNYRTQIYRRL